MLAETILGRRRKLYPIVSAQREIFLLSSNNILSVTVLNNITYKLIARHL